MSEPDARRPESPPVADPDDPATAPRPKLKELEVMVADSVFETPDTVTLVLFTGNDRLEYLPGHFITIRPQQFPALERFTSYFEDLKGHAEPARAYSLTSAPHERMLAITVKEELYVSGQTKFPPLLSPLLVYRTPRGTRMTVTGFAGPYVVQQDIEARTDHLVHICAGSGIVPNYSILKHCLETGLKLRHTLIYGNKSWQDTIFARQLAELEQRYPQQLKVVHALSRDPDWASHGAAVRQGRVSEALLREHIDDPTAVHVYACGPAITRWDRLRAKQTGTEATPRFLETVLAALASIGVPRERIHRESYG